MSVISHAAAPADWPRFDLGLRSEQFTVHDTRKFGRSLAAFADAEKNNPKWIQLEPEAVLISAERVRDALLRDLRLPARAAGMIQCYLYAPVRSHENITIVSSRYADGWVYTLHIPDAVERLKVIRAFVQVLLVHFANQGTAQKSAEIPTWLVEGIALHLQSDVGPELIVSGLPENAAVRFGNAKVSLQRTERIILGADRLLGIREYLRTGKALSFTELSIGLPPSASEEALQRYQISAHLFVAQLLRSPGGPAQLANMLRGLPECWNWQTAFLQAFGFERLLDVEKWWSLAVMTFLHRDTTLFGSLNLSLDRLDHILTVVTQVRANPNAIPQRAEARLSEVLSEWDYAMQRPVLQQKLLQLVELRQAAALPLAPLIDGYQECLHAYLQKRDGIGESSSGKREVVLPLPMLIRQTARQLGALDEQRAAFRAQTAAPGAPSIPPLANRP